LAWLVSVVRPDFASQFLTSQSGGGFWSFFTAATLRRLSFIGGLITLVVFLFPTLLLIIHGIQPDPDEQGEQALPRTDASPIPFVGLLILLGVLLVLAPEFVYLRDQFGTRMNTIFKFYYQAWMLWSLAASFGIAFLMRKISRQLFVSTFFSGLLIVSLVYPVYAFYSKTNGFKPPAGFTLDDFDRIRRENPDEAGAIEYLRGAPDGIVAEAIGGSYSGFARISTYTGLPTVLGWPGHEVQWRGTAEPLGSRQEDIASLYTTEDWQAAKLILDKYQVRYVVVGALERQTYAVAEDKFRNNLVPAYQTGTISVYMVP
jgi:uncharacterized membrane protein